MSSTRVNPPKISVFDAVLPLLDPLVSIQHGAKAWVITAQATWQGVQGDASRLVIDVENGHPDKDVLDNAVDEAKRIAAENCAYRVQGICTAAHLARMDAHEDELESD